MKITPYDPAVDAPGPAQAEFMQQNPGPVSLGVVAQTGSELRQAGTEVIRRERYVADLKLHEEQINQAYQGKISAAAKLDDAEQEVRDGKIDPDTREVLKAPATGNDYAPQVQEHWNKIRKDTLDAVDPGVRPYLSNMLAQVEMERMHQARKYGNMLWRREEGASTIAWGESAARMASDLRRTPQERDDIANTYLGALSLKTNVFNPESLEKMREKFNNDRYKSQAQNEIENPLGSTYMRSDYEGKLNALTLDSLDQHALTVANRVEARERKLEAVNKVAQQDREIEISSMIDKGQLVDAKVMLEHYADTRKLTPTVIDKLRKAINDPITERLSDPAIGGRIGLDVASINPRTTMEEIDALYDKHKQGMPGLNLSDATKYKLELRNTMRVLQEKDKSFAMRDHQQAEQNLRSALGIRPDLLQSAMKDSPEARLYGRLLPELVRRSDAYAGTSAPGPHNENALSVFESMVPRINEALGKPAALKPKELQGLYPDFKSLERARNDRTITEDDFQGEMARRAPPAGLPKAQPAPPPAKRQSGSFNR